MAPFQVSLASAAHRPSIAISLIIFFSACLLPFLALPSSNLITAATLPRIADTLWEFLLTIAKSSRFYFFLLNFVIVTLVCSSRMLRPSSERPDFEELGAEDPHQSDLYSAAHALHDSLALDQIYESQGPSPSFLRLRHRSNLYTADEIYGGNDRLSKPSVEHLPSIWLQGPALTDADAIDAAATSPSSDEDSIKASMAGAAEDSSTKKTLHISPAIPDRANIVAADVQDFHADRQANTEEAQICDEGEESDMEGRHEADNEADAQSIDDASGSKDAFSTIEELDRALEPQTPEMHQMMAGADEDEQVKDGNGDGASKLLSDETVGGDGGRSSSEGEEEGVLLGSGAGEEEAEVLGEGDAAEEAQTMSREELNKRASAFISAFRRKLVVAARVDE